VQFLVMSHRRTEQFADADFERVLPEETDRARQLYAEGVIRQIWSRDDQPGSCFIIEAASLEAAGAVVDELPMARLGLSAFTLTPLRPYRGFG
jgi:muconolactone delta-isomerase